MIDVLEEKLKQNGWLCRNESSKRIVYKNLENGYQNFENTYAYDENGVYKTYQGRLILAMSLGSLNDNFIALYCLLNNNRLIIEEEIKEALNVIENAKTPLEIKQIYMKYLDEKYIVENLNLDVNKTKNNALNLSLEDDWFSIKYIVNDSFILISETNKLQSMYKQVLVYLILKKKFDEDVMTNLNNHNLTDENKLELYNIYATGDFVKIKETKKKVL